MVTIRPATINDAAGITMLMCELNAFYGDEPSTISPEELTEEVVYQLFECAPPAGFVLLAFDDKRLVGMLSYAFAWPGRGFSRIIFIKELFVVESARNKGAGTQLFCECCEIADSTCCSRIEWQADLTNPAAHVFYESLANKLSVAGLVNGAKVSYQISDRQSLRLARHRMEQ